LLSHGLDDADLIDYAKDGRRVSSLQYSERTCSVTGGEPMTGPLANVQRLVGDDLGDESYLR
jgi:hypothetical protein